MHPCTQIYPLYTHTDVICTQHTDTHSTHVHTQTGFTKLLIAGGGKAGHLLPYPSVPLPQALGSLGFSHLSLTWHLFRSSLP